MNVIPPPRRNTPPAAQEVQPSTIEAEQTQIQTPALERVAGSIATEAAVQTPERQLGNPDLPIADFRERISQSVIKHQAVIITAETGAGKSTQAPQFFLEDLRDKGYSRQTMTQPRRMAARNVAQRISSEVVSALGSKGRNLVGWQTSEENTTTPKTRISVVTDGLLKARMLSGDSYKDGKQLFVLDEVHEWNRDQELIVALAKERMEQDPDFRVVFMSATLDKQALAQFLAVDASMPPPVIEVPGRTFGVTKRVGGYLVPETAQAARDGKVALVFAPGVKDIKNIVSALRQEPGLEGCMILPLHAQLNAKEQQKAMESYEGGKIIVSTNIAQTSLTIPDVDVVIDPGLENRLEIRNGVEGLYLGHISQADCEQRAGRAGRTKPGEYISVRMDPQSEPPLPFEEREPFPVPEIRRTRIDGIVLDLAAHGRDATKIEFFHQPNKADIQASKDTLQRLGALDERGMITAIGRKMEGMPVDPHYSRMLVEAAKFGPVVHAKVAAMVASEVSGGLAARDKQSTKSWQRLTSEASSDSLRELDLFIAAQNMDPQTVESYELNAKNLGQARKLYKQLCEKANVPQPQTLEAPTLEEREQLLRSIIAGQTDRLFVGAARGYWNAQDTTLRQLGNRSALVEGAFLLVGEPYDYGEGNRKRSIIKNTTKVADPKILFEIAPHLVETRIVALYSNDGSMRQTEGIYFNGNYIGEASELPLKTAAKVAEPKIEKVQQPIHDTAQSDTKTRQPEVIELAENSTTADPVTANRHVPTSVAENAKTDLSQAEKDRQKKTVEARAAFAAIVALRNSLRR